MKGARRRGRQRKRWEDNVTEWTGLDFPESQRAAEDSHRGLRKTESQRAEEDRVTEGCGRQSQRAAEDREMEAAGCQMPLRASGLRERWTLNTEHERLLLTPFSYWGSRRCEGQPGLWWHCPSHNSKQWWPMLKIGQENRTIVFTSKLCKQTNKQRKIQFLSRVAFEKSNPTFVCSLL